MGVTISNSMAKSFQRCKKQYDYKFKELIVPKTQGLPLYRGNWLHELLEAWYATGEWKPRHKELTKEYRKLFDEEKEQYGDLPLICGRIMASYVYNWRHEEADWNVVATEAEYEVPLPHGHTFKFKLDALIEDDWGLWLMEHKSHKTIPDSNYRFIDIQTARYFWGIQQVGFKPIGVLWNYIRTKQPGIPHVNKNGKMSKAKIDTDLYTYVSTLRKNGLDPHDYPDVISRLKARNTFFQRERMPKPRQVAKALVKDLVYIADEIERGYHPARTIDRSCSYMCSYLQPCLADLYGGDASQIIKSQFRSTDKTDYYANPEKEQ